MTAPLKFFEKGIFKSKERAYTAAKRLKASGKKVRVEKQILPSGITMAYGTCYSLKVKALKPFFGRNYIIDTKK